MNRKPVIAHLALGLALLAAAAAPAGAGDLAVGPRLGYTHDTHLDQVHAGLHVVARNLAPNLHLVPSFEVGWGDGTLVALNGDLVWEFTEMASGGWSYYAGGGPVLTRYRHGRFKSDDFALNLVVGVTRELRARSSFLTEVRLGLEDAPTLKITAGVTFF